MVLPGKTSLAGSAHTHVSTMGDSIVEANGLFAATRGVGWVACFMFDPREMGPRRILCGRILCGLAVSSARLFRRLFLPLLLCERSFSISGEHGTSRPRWRCDNHGLHPSGCSCLAASRRSNGVVV